MKTVLASLAAVLLSFSGAASADPQPFSGQTQADPVKSGTAASSAPLPEVMIEAQRAAIARRVSTLLFHITLKSFDAIALWRTPICPLVAGLSRDWGEFVLARISEVAAASGAPLAPKVCQPNFYVVVTTAPEELLKTWYAHDYGMFGDAWPKTVREFISTPWPVRIWYNTALAGADDDEFLSLDASFAYSQFNNIPANTHAHASRLRLNSVADLSSVVVVVDFTSLEGMQLPQVADYIAMIGLTKLKLNADLGDAPTILRLFTASAGDAPSGLSNWDQAFLRELYHTSHASRGQLAEITHKVVSDVSP